MIRSRSSWRLSIGDSPRSSVQVMRVDAVMRDLGHSHPFQAGGVADRFAQSRRRVAVGDDVEPVAVSAVLGDPPFVRTEQHTAVGVADAL